ncbi:MAG TPA: hypothetical protein DCM71_20805 [Runella sp.]|nr:hypothetical protein [Runella sp.]
MKPKIFIGSSVEGLSVGYSIQQNLTHDADVTVWDQGVFELSKTTIESLLDILDKSDFGIFVFSPDDISVIRQEKKNVVRDNIIFEFGLFVGKLSRERVFFVIPSGSDFHLPTDLLGITPGKYDPNREDKSLQAATGPLCHQIRTILKKLGTINISEETAKEPEKKDKIPDEDYSWIDLFINKDYDEVIKVLEEQLKSEIDNNKIIDKKTWLCYAVFKKNETDGIRKMDEFLLEFETNFIAHREIAKLYLWEDYLDKSISILENAILKFEEEDSLYTLLSECYRKEKGDQFALNFLESQSTKNSIAITLEQVSIYSEQKDYIKAKKAIHKIYLCFPNNEIIRYNYARIALEISDYEIALFFLRSLTTDFPKNSTYWGYLSNCCVALDFYDLAMVSAKKANEINENKEEWINSNIGNMLKNKGFYSEGIIYLEKGLEMNKNSDYAHDRLATSLKLREEELTKVNEKVKEGRKLLRQYDSENILQSKEFPF